MVFGVKPLHLSQVCSPTCIFIQVRENIVVTGVENYLAENHTLKRKLIIVLINDATKNNATSSSIQNLHGIIVECCWGIMILVMFVTCI